MMYLGAGYNDSTPFFLDTLCVPVGQATKTVTARKKLITKMWAIYKHASFVVVRDQGLIDFSKRLSADELIFRIMISPWFSRLWTMQEGAVATKLKVCMADGVVDFDELAVSLGKAFPLWKLVSRGSPQKDRVSDIWEYMLVTVNRFKMLRDDSTNSKERRQRVFDMAQNRRTSKEEDELMCISGIMGFSQDQMSVMSEKSDFERTEWVVEELHRVPQSLVLCDRPRLQSRGFRWCPERIVRHWDATDPEFHVVRAGEGLYGEWKTVLFVEPCGFHTNLARTPADGLIDLGAYRFTIRLDSKTLPGGPSSIMIGIDSDEGLEALRAIEGQPLALLTPIKLYAGRLVQDSILVVSITQDTSQHGYGTRKVTCRAIWETDEFQINFHPASPNVPGRLWDMPGARRFWVID